MKKGTLSETTCFCELRVFFAMPFLSLYYSIRKRVIEPSSIKSRIKNVWGLFPIPLISRVQFGHFFHQVSLVFIYTSINELRVMQIVCLLGLIILDWTSRVWAFNKIGFNVLFRVKICDLKKSYTLNNQRFVDE